jgi:hypothetical protein
MTTKTAISIEELELYEVRKPKARLCNWKQNPIGANPPLFWPQLVLVGYAEILAGTAWDTPGIF